MTKNSQAKFRQAILDFPQQFSEAKDLAKDIFLEKDFDLILAAGMGGSAWPAEILKTYLSDPDKKYLKLHRNYGLPQGLPKNTLVVLMSYSGNTEETLSAYKEAGQLNLARIAITSGGQLKEKCFQENVPVIEIPKGLEPRMATGYFFPLLTKVAEEAVPALKDKYFQDTLKLAKELKPQQLEEKGQELAEKFKGKIPLIYTSEQLKILAFIWKIKINEGAKIPAFYNFFPELNHNEFSAFTQPDLLPNPLQVLFLKNLSDHPRIVKRMDLSEKIIQKQGVQTETVNLIGENMLEKIFSGIILSDWLTCFLAQHYQVDPLATQLQEDFKQQMNR